MFSARAIDRMAGGVERMVIAIMNAMNARGHAVDLLTWDMEGGEAFYPMAAQITWHRLNLGDPARKASKLTMLRRAVAIRKLVRDRRPQVIVGFQDGPFMALRLYTFGLGVPVIVAERNAPTRFEHTRAGWRKKWITFNSFRLAKSVIVQCESYRALYPAFLHDRIVSIPNPVYPTRLEAAPARPDDRGRFRLLTVGRLSYQKNYESLISTFARIADRFPAWDLVIIGEGEERSKLEALIRDTGLIDRIQLPGNTTNTSDQYANAHLFCLSSRWEGFPNALAEAQAHGLPVVGYAGCSGVNELIHEGVTGRLAEGNGNIESLSAALVGLMASAEDRQRMGAAGPVAIRSLDPDLIMDRWEHVLERAISK